MALAFVPKLLEDPSGNVSQIPPLKRADDGGLAPKLLVILYQAVQTLIDRFNGLISLGTGVNNGRVGNLDAQYILNIQTPCAADEEFEVLHSLDRIPVGIWVIKRNKPVVIYAGDTDWNTTSIYLKASASFLSPDADAVISLVVW